MWMIAVASSVVFLEQIALAESAHRVAGASAELLDTEGETVGIATFTEVTHGSRQPCGCTSR